MNATLNTQSMPFRFLLYTEWVMLGSCGVLAIIEAWQTQRIPIAHILILLTLLVMGLALPRVKPALAYLYTALQMGLILIGTTLGYLHILPTLYLIVMIRSCFLLQPPGRLLVAGLSFIFFAVHQVQYLTAIMPMWLPAMGEQRIWMHQIAEFLMFGLSLFLVSRLVTTLIVERRTQERLTQAHQQLRQYSLQIEELAAVQERNRIAREIHDSLGHHLTVFNLHLSAALRLLPTDPEEAIALLEEVKQLGATALQEVRQSVGQLRTDPLQGNSLETALQTLASEVHKSTGVLPDLKVQLQRTLPRDVQVALYRIVQESLTNICKYAQASAIQICLTADAELQLTIADNGEGFDLSQNTTGFGLQGMKERVTALGGTLTIRTAPGQGCEIIVCCPLPAIETF